MPRGFRIGYARAVRMSGDGSTYSVSGQNAGVNRGWFVAAAAGSYAATGRDASFSIGGAPASSSIALLYTDLSEGTNTGGRNNNGEIITLLGKGFGASQTGSAAVTLNGVAVADVLSWSDTKVVIQPGASTSTGNFAITNSSGQTATGCLNKPDGSASDFTVRSGTIYFVAIGASGTGTFADPIGPSGVLSRLGAGVTFYFRGGTYTTLMGQTNWSAYNITLGSGNSGSSGNRMQFVGYPGETAIFTGQDGCFQLRDGASLGNRPQYITIAGLTLDGYWTCVSGGGLTSFQAEVQKSGALSIRVVNNICSANYTAGQNSATGLISAANDGWRILGNELKDTGIGTPVNNNHAVYVQVGASDIDVAWNYFHDLRMGYVIQVHTDTAFTYTNVRIHHNLLTSPDPQGCRGFTCSNTLSGTTGSMYGNVLSGVGQEVSGLMLYSGTWSIFNNTFHAIAGGSGVIVVLNDYGGTSTSPTVTLRNNIIYGDGATPYIGLVSGATSSQLTESNNLYFNGTGGVPGYASASVNSDPLFTNAGTFNFTLQSGSPARNAGSSAVSSIYTFDRNGVPLPQGASYDIGAYEYV